jgi:hypothetical protein
VSARGGKGVMPPKLPEAPLKAPSGFRSIGPRRD